MKLLKIVAILFVLSSLNACAWLESITTGVEPPVATHESYLQGGPNTDVELGADERTLLEDYKQLNDQRIQLETQLAEARAENQQLRSQLNSTEQERDEFRNHLAGSNTEGDRLQQRTRDLEAKVLSLNIEKTLLEQELLRLRIGSLRAQYEEIVATPGGSNAGPMGGRR